jgi:predicted HicB family RNase H-like nuclease
MGRRRNEPTRRLRPARFGIYLDPETHKALLQAALHENTSATELVERLIKRYLRGRRKT